MTTMRLLESTTTESSISMLSDEKRVNEMNEKDFLDLIIADDKTAEFALKTPYICQKLNAIVMPEHMQTFNNSCAAKGILKMMTDFNIIDKKHASRVIELAIYSKIWTEPGGQADPDKMVSFLLNQGFETTLVEITDRTQDLLNSVPEEIKFAYHAIKNNTQLIKKSVKDAHSIALDDNSILLLDICIHGTHIHVLHARNHQDEFVVSYPEQVENPNPTVAYKSFTDFYKNHASFTGLMFMVSRSKTDTPNYSFSDLLKTEVKPTGPL